MSKTNSLLLIPTSIPAIPSDPTVVNAALTPMAQLKNKIFQLQTMQNTKPQTKYSQRNPPEIEVNQSSTYSYSLWSNI